MSVLEAPQTWIAAAAVLVVAAVVLVVLAPRRRGGPTAPAGDGPSSPPATPGTAADTPSADTPGADPDDDIEDAVTAPVPPARAAAAEHTSDDAVTTETAAPTRAVPARPVRRYVPVTDPARADERAKDRLLAILLVDPTAAVDVVAALPETGGASGASAAALLRAGLSPTQAASLCGVDERDLADVVARDLGLLEVVVDGQDPAAAEQGSTQQGRSHTEEPGRAWASAGSSSSSTTPTTG